MFIVFVLEEGRVLIGRQSVQEVTEDGAVAKWECFNVTFGIRALKLLFSLIEIR